MKLIKGFFLHLPKPTPPLPPMMPDPIQLLLLSQSTRLISQKLSASGLDLAPLVVVETVPDLLNSFNTQSVDCILLDDPSSTVLQEVAGALQQETDTPPVVVVRAIPLTEEEEDLFETSVDFIPKQVTSVRSLHRSITNAVALYRTKRQVRDQAKALKTLQEQSCKILNTLPEAIFMLDKQGRILFASQPACSLLDAPESGLLGTLFTQWLSPDNSQNTGSLPPEHPANPLHNPLHLGVSHSIRTLSLKGHTGKPIKVKFSASPLLEGNYVEGALIKLIKQSVSGADEQSEPDAMGCYYDGAALEDGFVSALVNDLESVLVNAPGSQDTSLRLPLQRLLNCLRLAYCQPTTVTSSAETPSDDLGNLMKQLFRSLSPSFHQAGIELLVDLPVDFDYPVVAHKGQLQLLLASLLDLSLHDSAPSQFSQEALSEELSQARISVQAKPKTEQTLEVTVHLTESGALFRQSSGKPAPASLSSYLCARLARQFQGTLSENKHLDAHNHGYTLTFLLQSAIALQPGLSLEESTCLPENALGEVSVSALPVVQKSVWQHYASIQGLPVLVFSKSSDQLAICREWFTHWGMYPTLVEDELTVLNTLKKAAMEETPFPIAVVDTGMMNGSTNNGPELLLQIQVQLGEMAPLMVVLTDTQSISADEAQLVAEQFQVSAVLSKPINPSQLLDALMTLSGDVMIDIASDEALPAALKQASGKDAGCHILVAEDNTFTRHLVCHMLEKLGHYPVAVSNGKDALLSLSTARQHPFDLILSDKEMPGMGGVEFLKKVRTHHTYKKIPFVLMTAYQGKDEEEEAKKLGATVFLAKPFTIASIAEKLSTALATPSVTLEKESGMVKGNAFSRRTSVSPHKPGGNNLPLLSGFRHPLLQPPSSQENSPMSPFAFNRTEFLNRLDGDSELLEELVGLFISEWPNLLEAVSQAISAESPQMLQESAHALKGACANINADVLRDYAYQLEMMGKDQHLNGAYPIYQKLVEGFAAFREAVLQSQATV